MEEITRFLPFLIPVILLQFVLLAAALIDLVRRERTRGPKWAWVLIILLVSFIGPIVYFMLGREDS